MNRTGPHLTQRTVTGLALALFLLIATSGSAFQDLFLLGSIHQSPEFEPGARFGHSVAIDGDLAVVGARDQAGIGHAYAYVRNATDSGRWDLYGDVFPFGDPDLTAGAEFGGAVAVSGDTIAVGARLAENPMGVSGINHGLVWVFEPVSPGVWSWQKVAPPVETMDANAGDFFGFSVDLYGDRLIVGAPGDDEAGVNAGAAYVFLRRPDGSWELQEKRTPSYFGDRAGDNFGWSVAISSHAAAAGAPRADTRGADSGDAEIWDVRAAGTPARWLSSTVGPLTGAQLGNAVDLDDKNLVIGAWRADYQGVSAGAAWVVEYFTQDPPGFVGASVRARLEASNTGPNQRFGYAVAVSDGVAVVGTEFANGAYVFYRDVPFVNYWGEDSDRDGWKEPIATLLPPGVIPGDFYGAATAVARDAIVVAAPGDASFAGKAYFHVGAPPPVPVGSTVGDNVRFGAGVTIGDDVIIGDNVTVGNFVTIEDGATIEDRATVGSSTLVGAGATIAPDATVGSGVTVGAGAFVGPGAEIQDGAYLAPESSYYKAASVGEDTSVGDRSVIYYGASVGDDAMIGERVYILALASVGDRTTIGDLSRIYSGVVIGDDVVIGSRVTVYRDSSVGNGTVIGDGSYVGGSVSIGASVTIEDRVSVAGNAQVGDNAILREGARVLRDAVVRAGCEVAAGSTYPDDGCVGG